MIVIIFGIAGAFMGGRAARTRGGNRKDIAQHAAGYAFAFMVVGLIVSVLLDRWFLAG